MCKILTSFLAGLLISCSLAFGKGGSENLSLNGTKSLSYEENRGQIIDNAGVARPDILFKASDADMDFYIRETGISYVFNHTFPGSSAEQDSLLKLGLIDDEEGLGAYQLLQHRVDIEFVGSRKP